MEQAPGHTGTEHKPGGFIIAEILAVAVAETRFGLKVINHAISAEAEGKIRSFTTVPDLSGALRL
ncbi:hypothetical protein KKI24_03875 [bacterium]|nr:hypothetical protein [bacterium]